MRRVVVIAVMLLGFIVLIDSAAFTAEVANWSGVDETVVEKYAKAAGCEPWEPFINTDQGDLLLFVFLVAGALGGFVMGYHFRTLFPPRTEVTGEPSNV